MSELRFMRLCCPDCPCRFCQRVRFFWMLQGWCDYPGIADKRRWADLARGES